MSAIKARLRKANTKRLGLEGYCRILRSLYVQPATGAEASLAHDVNGNTMSHVLRSLHRVGLTHHQEWVRPKAHSVLVPVWAGGEGDDAVPAVAAPRRSNRRARNAAIVISTVKEILDEPTGMKELAVEMGLHRETCIRIIRIMRTHKLVHIVRWDAREKGGGDVVPIYGFGPRRDANKPAPRATRCPEAARRHSAAHYAKRKQLELIRALAGVRRSVFDPVAEAAP